MKTQADELAQTRRRWRGQTWPQGQLARELRRAESSRLALARLVYGQQPR